MQYTSSRALGMPGAGVPIPPELRTFAASSGVATTAKLFGLFFPLQLIQTYVASGGNVDASVKESSRRTAEALRVLAAVCGGAATISVVLAPLGLAPLAPLFGLIAPVLLIEAEVLAAIGGGRPVDGKLVGKGVASASNVARSVGVDPAMLQAAQVVIGMAGVTFPAATTTTRTPAVSAKDTAALRAAAARKAALKEQAKARAKDEARTRRLQQPQPRSTSAALPLAALFVAAKVLL